MKEDDADGKGKVGEHLGGKFPGGSFELSGNHDDEPGVGDPRKPAQLAEAVTVLADLDARVKGGLREGEQLDAAQKLHALERDLISLAVE